MDFKGFFTDLFTQLSSDHSWLVLLFLLGAFLIGFITAWLYWRRKWKNVKNELALRTSELSSLRAKYDEQTRTLELKDADLKKANLEIEELTAKIRQLEEEKGQLHGDLHASRLDLEKLNTEKGELVEKEKDYLVKLDDFDTLVLGLKTKNQTLAVQADQDSNALNELAQLQSKFNAVSNKMDALEKENVTLKGSVKESQALSSSYSDYDDIKAKATTLEAENASLLEKLQNSTALNESYSDYDALKNKITDLGEENAELKQRLASLTSELDEAKTNNTNMAMAAAAVVPEVVVEESAEEKAANAQASVKAALGSKISAATADQKDDLKRINGVGPFIEQKLNNLGIYTFEQISQFDDELSNQVTDAIEFFPGRIQRDDWVGQAKILMGQKKEGGASVLSSVNVKKRAKLDDLKVVEGIGPKIEGLLKDGGINTWAELAAADVDRLKEILTAAGPRYKMHNPGTWPQQAGLAATSQWDALEKLQDELKGGRIA